MEARTSPPTLNGAIFSVTSALMSSKYLSALGIQTHAARRQSKRTREPERTGLMHLSHIPIAFKPRDALNSVPRVLFLSFPLPNSTILPFRSSSLRDSTSFSPALFPRTNYHFLPTPFRFPNWLARARARLCAEALAWKWVNLFNCIGMCVCVCATAVWEFACIRLHRPFLRFVYSYV